MIPRSNHLRFNPYWFIPSGLRLKFDAIEGSIVMEAIEVAMVG
jgi:hypothetical protein